MSNETVYPTSQAVAEAAVELTVNALSKAITQRGSAVWVLAGGSSPTLSYQLFASNFADAIDWSKVTILIGDERLVPFDHPDSNWGAIIKQFESSPELNKVMRLAPNTSLAVADSAAQYSDLIQQSGIDRFDVVWVGVGEDGHTLSLFPGNAAFTQPSKELVLPVSNSPKPPPERITLSLSVLKQASQLIIFAVGESKKEALKRARQLKDLPIAVAAQTVEQAGGSVVWLYDEAAYVA